MFTILNGRGMRSVSRKEIEREMATLKSVYDALEMEILNRTGNGDTFKYGYRDGGNYVALGDTFGEAVEEAARLNPNDPDVGYRVTKVYI